MGFFNNFLTSFLGNKSERDIKALAPLVEKVKEFDNQHASLSNDQLREVSSSLKQRIKDAYKTQQDQIDASKAKLDSEDTLPLEEREKLYNSIEKLESEIDLIIASTLEELLPETFSLVRETAKRFKENETLRVTASDFDRQLAVKKNQVVIEGSEAVWSNSWMAGGSIVKWDMVHYDVQIIGGAILHRGNIAEMATGEGKTLVATLPVFLNALPGRGVHIVTVNDYLAKRDSEWMGPIFEFHGLKVDCIDKYQPNSDDRRKAYNADITYGTNNEYGFDYLRDNMASNPLDLVQRIHNFAIVDEVDSVLIDDARTPLIISGPVPKGGDQLFNDYKAKVDRLFNAQKALINRVFVDAKKFIESEDKKQQEEGAKLLVRAFKGLPKNKALIKFLSEQGMKALMHKTENFYMAENNKNMHLVTDELFFIIDEKHNSIELTDKGIDFLSSDTGDKDFFVLPDIGAKIADIEKSSTSPEEILKQKDQLLLDYAIKSERVHTVNQLLKAYTLYEKDIEYVVIDNKVKIVDEQTGRIMEGRRYSDGLHQAIEAKENVKVEAATQTFATVTLQNYFRMYKKLAGMTGTAETEAKEFSDIYKLDVIVAPTNRQIVRKDMEDLVYKTRKEKFKAVIEHIVDLQNLGRPVLVGTTNVEVSELLSKMLTMQGIKHNVLNAKLHQKEADIVAEAGHPGRVTIATNMAGRGTDIKLSAEVKQNGGLAIVGTERHDSRRVDRQLRGRAGRQGDPGTSQFFVCLEDDLMRMFGSDRIAGMMDRLGLKEGEVIQHSMISKSIERAQKKVEENNFGVRKRLLEYDDVMNSQREVVYKRRRHALYGERIGLDTVEILFDTCESIVSAAHGNIDYDAFCIELIRHLSIECPFTAEEYLKNNVENLTEQVFKRAMEIYERKINTISEQAWPVVKHIYETQSGKYKNIAVPIADGFRVFNVVTDLEKAYKSKGKEVLRSFIKTLSLVTIDEAWKEHLREMDELKHSVQNAHLEQKDPLVIYKLESFQLFRTMLDKVNKEIISTFMKAQIPVQAEAKEAAEERKKLDLSRLQTQKSDFGSQNTQENKKEVKKEPIKVEKKIGRNDPCPCGSGKKYKQCCGKGEE
ncbi:MAG: preprotein translocase subunit SecA [Bacteroidales bacterium]|nr:preprotein translocase subunit SecA [Bacteroidales bacterium]